MLDQGGLLVALAQQQAVGEGALRQSGLVAAHIEGERLDQLTRLDVALILAGTDDEARLTARLQAQLGAHLAVGNH